MRGIPDVGTYVDGVWQIDTRRVPDAGVRRHRPHRSAARPAGHAFGRDSHGRRDSALDASGQPKSSAATSRPRSASLDRRDVKAAVDVPFTDKLLTKWTAASLSRDGYITEPDDRREKRRHRPDDLPRRHRLERQRQARSPRSTTSTTRTRSRSRKSSRTRFSDLRRPRHHGRAVLPEFYGTVAGLEPFSRPNIQAGFPGGQVGQWENRSNITVAEQHAKPSRHRSTSTGTSAIR